MEHSIYEHSFQKRTGSFSTSGANLPKLREVQWTDDPPVGRMDPPGIYLWAASQAASTALRILHCAFLKAADIITATVGITWHLAFICLFVNK